MTNIFQWCDIKERYHQGSLLLGNGSSIAVDSCFNYSSLYEKAIDLGHLTSNVQAVFDKFEVNDFELVLRRLWQAKLVNQALGLSRSEVEVAYEEVRKALISTVRDTHVTYDNARDHLTHIYQFMQNFDVVISLNYDLIVYWAAQYGNREIGSWFKDCFKGPTFNNDLNMYKKPYGAAKGTTLYFYPHGNLVLRRHGFSGAQKIQAGRNDNLLESIFLKWETEGLSPAFVCEGTEDNKREAISSCEYFEQVFYEVIPSIDEVLVIYGWGFGDQDKHIVKQLAKSKVKKIAVSIFGKNPALCGEIERKLSCLDLDELIFFDATSEGCWNNPTAEFLDDKKKESEEVTVVLNKVLGRS
jgi:hypothetical protein